MKTNQTSVLKVRLNPGVDHVKEKYKMLGLVNEKALGIVA